MCVLVAEAKVPADTWQQLLNVSWINFCECSPKGHPPTFAAYISNVLVEYESVKPHPNRVDQNPWFKDNMVTKVCLFTFSFL